MMKIKTGVSTLMMILACVVLASVLGCGGSSSSDGSGGSATYNDRFSGDFYVGTFSYELSADDYGATGDDMGSNGDGTGYAGSAKFTYSVAADNTMDFTEGGNTDKGILAPGEDFLAVVDTKEDDEVSLTAAVKLPSASVSHADVNGKWRFIQIRYNSDDGRANTAVIDATLSDGTASMSFVMDSNDATCTSSCGSFSYTLKSNGGFIISDYELEGYTDGAKMILTDEDSSGDKEVKIMVGIKMSESHSNADLKGDYQLMQIGATKDDAWTVHADVNFKGDDDGSGTGTCTATVIKVSDNGSTPGTVVNGTYHVDATTGKLALTIGSGQVGIISPDGEIFVARDMIANGSADYEVTFSIGVKKHS